MVKKTRKQKPDVNEIAFRVVQESTSEDNLHNRTEVKPQIPLKRKNSRSKPQ